MAIVALFFSAAAFSETFALHPRRFKVGPNPTAIVARDLTGDAWPEIVTADRGVMSDPREERPANDELSLLLAEGELERSLALVGGDIPLVQHLSIAVSRNRDRLFQQSFFVIEAAAHQ